MRVALQCDTPVVARTLAELLGRMRYEVLATPQPGMPLLRQQADHWELIAPDGSAQPIPTPVRLPALANLLRSQQRDARGTPLPLAHGWRLEPLARMLHHAAGQHVPLTEKETLLLTALHTARPKTASRDALLRDVWAYEADVETHTLETHIYRLRNKLSGLTPLPADIITVEGTYRLVVEEE